MTTQRIFKSYVCGLDNITQEKAEAELYEDPKNRQGAIDTFREWIIQQKHIKCPLDDVFLLGFLRGKHFSQLEAREALEYLMSQRQKLSDLMLNIDTLIEPHIDAVIDSGLYLWLGRDRDGRNVLLIRPAKAAKYLSNQAMRRTLCRIQTAICYYYYLEDEMSQVHGTVYAVDFSKYSIATDMKFPQGEKQQLTDIIQATFPARVKGFHLYNCGSMIEFLVTLLTSLMNEKLRKRLYYHNHGLESMYKYIPKEILPDEYLPDDYNGPSAGPEAKVMKSMKEKLRRPEIRERIKYLSSDQFYIDIKDKDTDVAAASFRKLIID